MTVPAGGGGVLGARKPLYRCIPEIHVTRLSASSSLRPKLGLLLLFVVLLVTLCLAGVPLVTKVLVPLVHSRNRPQPALTLGLDQALLEASGASERSFVTSAALTLVASALAAVALAAAALAASSFSTAALANAVLAALFTAPAAAADFVVA